MQPDDLAQLSREELQAIYETVERVMTVEAVRLAVAIYHEWEWRNAHESRAYSGAAPSA